MMYARGNEFAHHALHLVVFRLALLACLCTPIAHAGEVIESHVDRIDDHYLLRLDMRIEGHHEDVYNVLVDFNHITLLNDSITFSQVLESKDKVHRVQFETEGCVWFVCKLIKQAVTVTELGNGYIMSVTDPAHSDLKFGKTLWEIIDEGKTTRIKYNGDFVPDFWVPPLIGPIIYKNRLLEEGQKTINGIEHRVAELKQ